MTVSQICVMIGAIATLTAYVLVGMAWRNRVKKDLKKEKQESEDEE